MVNLRRTTAKELAPAVSVLQLFCSTSKPPLRFAAVRTLNQVSVLRTFSNISILFYALAHYKSDLFFRWPCLIHQLLLLAIWIWKI